MTFINFRVLFKFHFKIIGDTTMLQSEFFDRTKVTLTAEEYADVERIYNEVTLDKDDFCKQWKALRSNPLYIEMAEAIKKMEEALKIVVESKTAILHELDDTRIKMQTSMYEQEKAFQKRFEDFGREMIVHEEDDIERYEVIEKSFGLDFICKTKLEEDYQLEKNEREHLIKKLY